ncbi:Cytochrome c oxidase subunit 5A [Maudiozyma exigua]|uniref:Cytochrome c oxidase subunit 5A n=1 Tax=Maudiozyma exigua TaxID=34358 RepID=A0A9P7B5X9_MAUEX|nr:Cytochrome c oxidase subunit 5A [Kazachstania exigua]
MLRNTICRANITQLSARRFASIQAISKASITDLENRWEHMPTNEQESLVAKLTQRQTLPWKDLTDAEKQAAWYISYGSWGPRRPVLAKGEASYILQGVLLGLAISIGAFAWIRQYGGEDVKSMNKEWQLKSDEYLKSKNANPWGGYSQVQSK